MGYIVLGIFSFQQASIYGSMLQMLSHAMAVAGLFLLLGMLEQRCGPAYRKITALSTSAPRLAVLLMLFVLTSVALPLTSGFTAEFLVLFGAFVQGLTAWRADSGSLLLVAAVLASTGMVLGAAYMLRFARVILFGKSSSSAHLRDVGLVEMTPLAALLLFILWVGMAPATIMNRVSSVVPRLTLISSTHDR
jgi:NADH-quinone oxidoreductase subunit M